MVHEYSKLKPDKFTKHLQSVLTTYYEDIRAMPGASGCPKPKFLTRTLVIDDDTTTPEDGAGATQEVNAGAAADQPRNSRNLPPPPLGPPPASPPGAAARPLAVQAESLPRGPLALPQLRLKPKPNKLVCLNRSVT